MAIYLYFRLLIRTFKLTDVDNNALFLNIEEQKGTKTLVIRHLRYSKNITRGPYFLYTLDKIFLINY